MATGKTHDKITIKLIPVMLLFFILINKSFFNNLGDIITYTLLGISAYIFGGYMFSGDLDIISTETRRWGYLKFIWIPYQKAFDHRSIFTHGFILGPTIRLIYLYGITLIIFMILYNLSIINLSTYEIMKVTYEFIISNQILCLNLILGLFLGSGVHTATDIIHTILKKNFKIIRRKKGRKKGLFNF